MGPAVKRAGRARGTEKERDYMSIRAERILVGVVGAARTRRRVARLALSQERASRPILVGAKIRGTIATTPGSINIRGLGGSR